MTDRTEPLFIALTRPAVVYGVPLEGLGINVLGTFIAGLEFSGPTIWRSPFMFWALGIPIHMIMQRLTAYDYHWIRTIRLWALTVGRPTLANLPTTLAQSGKEIPSSG